MTKSLFKSIFLFGIAFWVSSIAFAQTPVATTKELGASLPAQAAAQALKNFAHTDGAFFAAGLLKDHYDQTKDLSTLLLYPEDQVMIVKMTGAQLMNAFERSVSLYPQPNTSFLQLSGFDVTFSKSAPINKRITTALVKGTPIDPSKSYTVAMPSSLALGGLGYFMVWKKSNIIKTFQGTTIESVLTGKPYVVTSPHWSVVP